MINISEVVVELVRKQALWQKEPGSILALKPKQSYLWFI